ncbi:DUF4442 domain-containing protein [Sphingopyxis sp. LC81]|uniref:DUF4442 domain-containing protein n=1 Tax=Sphingopyxis sp. LC81 TaxID=1502850 RepID=UPI00068B86A7|nr:DUF4442 domain-containing protein [Sphingopyxis sp. LC81]
MEMAASETEVEAALRRIFPIYEHAGLTVESARDGIYRVRLPLNRENGNHMNTVHAALQWAAAEVLGGLVVMAVFGLEQLDKMYGAVQSVSIDFQRPARSAIVAEALFDEREARRIEQMMGDGQDATFRLHAVVRDEGGATVAVTEAVYVVRPLRPAKADVRLDRAAM